MRYAELAIMSGIKSARQANLLRALATDMSYPLLICSVCARYVRAATRTPVGVSRSWPRRHRHSTLTGIWCTGWQIPGRKAPKGAR